MRGRRLYAFGGGAAVVVLAAGIALWSVTGSDRDGAHTGGPSAAVPSAAGPDGSTVDGSAAPSPALPSSAAAGSPAGWWRPRAGISWQWQLSGRLDRGVAADVYDVDGNDTPAADVAALRAAGRRVICYVNAGAFEKWRPDAGRFPAAVLGRELEGWPGERWLDIRRWDLLEPVLAARFDTCRQKGFDAVEPDNVDGYANRSGFPLSAADQLTFNRRLADLAHARGLAVGLKNDVDQAVALQPHFDFAVNEECVEYDECDTLTVFVRAGKPVFHVEYTGDGGFCATTRRLGFSSMRKKAELDAWRAPC